MANVPAPGGNTSDNNQGSSTDTPANTDVTGTTYAFIASWLLIIVLLTMASKTRLGYVIIYYGLLLIIFGILVTEYNQIAPLFNPITVGELNAQS